MAERTTRRTDALILIAILVAAALIRLWGIGWGLPMAYHPDEGSVLIHALGFGTGDMNPHWFRWPSLPMYVMFGVYGAYYFLGKLMGTFAVPLDMARQYLVNPSPLWLLGRLVSVVAGVATVWFTFLFGRRAFGRFAGLAAAAFMAVAFLHVRDSHYATPDVLATALASISLLFALKSCRSAQVGHLALAGLFAGLAGSAKYPAALAGAGMLAAYIVLIARRRAVSWHFPAAVAAGVFGFLLGTPFSVLSRSEFARDFFIQYDLFSPAGIAVQGREYLTGISDVFARILPRALGLAILAPAVLGILFPSRVWASGAARSASASGESATGHSSSPESKPAGGPLQALASDEPALMSGPDPVAGKLLAIVFTLAVLLFVALSAVRRGTDLLPCIPAIVVLAAAGLGGLPRVGFGGRPARVAFAAVTVALVLLAAWPSVQFDRAISVTDTRTRSREWIEGNVPAGTAIALEEHGPILNPTYRQIALIHTHDTTRIETWKEPKSEIKRLMLEQAWDREPQYEVYGIDWGEPIFRLPGPGVDPARLAALVDSLRVRYVVLTSKAEPKRPMAGAEPPSVGRSWHNPVVEIYELLSADDGSARSEETHEALLLAEVR